VANDISVALCTFNGVRFIGDQVRSLYRQELLPAQIVVADDGSRDGTLELLRTVATQEDPTGRVELSVLAPSPSPLGPGQNFQRALAACVHPTIALCDQDDVWRSDKLAACAEALERSGADLVVSNARVVDADLRPRPAHLPGADIFSRSLVPPRRRRDLVKDPLGRVLRDNFAPGMTFVFRRELVEAAAPVPESWLHDYWLMFVAAARGGVEVVDELLVDYRMHDSNAVANAKPEEVKPWFDHALMWSLSAERVREVAATHQASGARVLAKLDFEERRFTARQDGDVAALVRGFVRCEYRRFVLRWRHALVTDLRFALAAGQRRVLA
jgi:glycosyltransferase involved in cell wall biosynthesis